MNQDDTARLIYLVILGGAIVTWFFAQNRQSLGKTAQQAVVWGLIFAGVLAVIGLWGDIRGTILPGRAALIENDRIELRRARDGHYYVTAQVNGKPVDFVVDTGASTIVLTLADARRAGIDTQKLAFIGRAGTANGEISTAPVRLDRLSIGSIADHDVAAVVNSGEMDHSLLGMSYLHRYRSVEITKGR
ncbi:MAG: TIGR02281 family clan AA aspartic protease, partial [Qingshengfaniella sp.]